MVSALQISLELARIGRIGYCKLMFMDKANNIALKFNFHFLLEIIFMHIHSWHPA